MMVSDRKALIKKKKETSERKTEETDKFRNMN